jgi:hypothetical protein
MDDGLDLEMERQLGLGNEIWGGWGVERARRGGSGGTLPGPWKELRPMDWGCYFFVGCFAQVFSLIGGSKL